VWGIQLKTTAEDNASLDFHNGGIASSNAISVRRDAGRLRSCPGQSFAGTIGFSPVSAEPAQGFILLVSNADTSPDTVKAEGKSAVLVRVDAAQAGDARSLRVEPESSQSAQPFHDDSLRTPVPEHRTNQSLEYPGAVDYGVGKR
jgi:hypothetical protein